MTALNPTTIQVQTTTSSKANTNNKIRKEKQNKKFMKKSQNY